MPIVFSAKLDGSEAVRFSHVSLVTFYLRQARSRAVSASSLPPSEEQFSESLLAVILAALCLEAFANEWAENIFESNELADFMKFRRDYRIPEGIGSVAWKLSIVFGKKWGLALPRDTGLLRDIDTLFETRNELVHYKLSESAAKNYLPPPVQISDPGAGTIMTLIDFELAPTRVEEALVQRVNATLAARSYNTALRALKLWNEKAGAPSGTLSAHTELSEQ